MIEEYCVFCDPKARMSRVIYSNKIITSFLSGPRLIAGHTLVIPNRHIELPTDLSNEESGAIFKETKRLVKKMFDSGLGDGVDTWQKTRPLVPEGKIKVNHLHFHVIPSKPGDQIYTEALAWSEDKFSELTESEASELVGILRG